MKRGSKVFKSLFTISIFSLGAGFSVQLILCGLYVSAVMVPEDPALWLLLALYMASETLGTGVLLFAGSIPLQVLVFGKMKREDPDVYPLSAVGIGIGISVSTAMWAGEWDWRLFALLVPTAFFFGGMWWNRIGLPRLNEDGISA
ncbi:hypothetical protein [Kroppenstedtia guangzhouensis]|uniref:hypothetical protein n=1 Tax=Kroppenstedtia guangzhouensis TaxID=1274356 RepID=UPI0016690F0B|nr:hypothetical protein [Kroppenstedtia guangzhouensis]